MNEIKFSHRYYKMPLPLPFKAKLLHVFITNTKFIHKDFMDYDTAYFHPVKFDRAFYELPKGTILVLLLLSEDKKLFTTIRRYTPQKWNYYNGKRGEIFDCVGLGDGEGSGELVGD